MSSASTPAPPPSFVAAFLPAPMGMSVARLLRIALLVAAVPPLLQLGFRYIDPDEFQHAQMAWLMAQGRVPFRDFFEHHMPVLHALAAPLMAAARPEEGAGRAVVLMMLLRMASLVLTFGNAWLAHGLARRLGLPAPAALLAALLFLGSGVVLQRGQEFRPDVPATAFVLLACLAMTAEAIGGPARRAAMVGLCAGLAVVMTQKAVLLLPGLGLAFAWRLIEERRGWRDWAAALVAGSLAAAAPLAGLLAAFGAVGAAGDLWSHVFSQHADWPVQRPVLASVGPALLSSPVTALLFFIGAPLVLVAAVRAGQGARGPALMLPVVASGVAGMYVLPIFYEQYVMLFMGPVAVLAATAAAALLRWASAGGRAALVVLLLAGAAALQPWAHMARQAFDAQLVQWRAILEAHALAGPEDMVMSGFATQFPFRLPATSHFFFHEEICAGLSDDERREVRMALEAEPRLRVAAEEVAACIGDPAVEAALRDRFAPTTVPGLMRRREGG